MREVICIFMAGVLALPQRSVAALSDEVAPVPPPSSGPQLSAEELEKLVMPIALHPDPLLSVVLPASAYPVEIVQAARFVRDTNNIARLDDQPWDENVKAVAHFPEMIAKLDADLAWTIQLGDAFVEQPKEVMDAIQSMRNKAFNAKTLQTTPQQIVSVTNVIIIETNLTQIITVTNRIVEIVPSNPQVIYVPTYPPTVYYPPPSYVYNPYAPLIAFGIGFAWGAYIHNRCHWNSGRVYVHSNVNINRNINRNVNRDVNRDRNTDRNRPQQLPRDGDRGSGGDRWQPDQTRRNKSSGSAQSREARGWGSGESRSPSTGNVGSRPATGTGTSRPSTGIAAGRPSTGGLSAGSPTTRPATGAPTSRPSTGTTPSTGNSRPSTVSPATTPSTGRGSGNRSSGSPAFNGVNTGSNAHDYGNRGSASRTGTGGSGRGGGRGR